MTALVIGAGPAGLAATAALARSGVAVTLIDRYDEPGGQIGRAPRAGRPTTDRWAGLAAAAGHPGVTHLRGATIIAVQRTTTGPDPRTDGARTGFRAIVQTGGRIHSVDGDAVVLCTGSREVVTPFPGWTLPGVVTAGAVQAIAKRTGSLPWSRIGLGGSGPLLLAVAQAMRKVGSPPQFTLEARPLPHLLRHGARTAVAQPGKAAQFLKLAGPRPPRFGWRVIEAVGMDRVEAAVIASIDGDGQPTALRTVPLDALAVSDGLIPDVGIALQLGCATTPTTDGVGTKVTVDGDQRTSVDGVWAAGELTGVGGADKATAEGRLAGATAAAALTGTATRAGDTLRDEVTRWRRFTDDLQRLYPVDHRWGDRLPGGELVCRCEEVPMQAVRRAIADGAHTPRAVKGLTRTGMGMCQGAVCSPLVRSALAAAGHPDTGDLESRPLAAPVTLAELAQLAPPPPEISR